MKRTKRRAPTILLLVIVLLAVSFNGTPTRSAAMLTPCGERAILSFQPAQGTARRGNSPQKLPQRLARIMHFAMRLLITGSPVAGLFAPRLSRILS